MPEIKQPINPAGEALYTFFILIPSCSSRGGGVTGKLESGMIEVVTNTLDIQKGIIVFIVFSDKKNCPREYAPYVTIIYIAKVLPLALSEEAHNTQLSITTYNPARLKP